MAGVIEAYLRCERQYILLLLNLKIELHECDEKQSSADRKPRTGARY